jgi:transcription elongation factor GreB
VSKAFTKEGDAPEPEDDGDDEIVINDGNYMTPEGHKALQDEFNFLWREERPRITEIVSWAAGNGDRSENGDYLYNKKRLREIDRRLRYLTKRLDKPTIVDPKKQQGLERVFFGATVTYAREDGTEMKVHLVGVDEADVAKGKINWQSPVGRALMKAQIGDEVTVRETGEVLEVLDIEYVIPN